MMVYYCTCPTVWPDPFLTGSARSKAKPAPACWEEFDTEDARVVHWDEAHFDYMEDVRRGEVIRANNTTPVPTSAFVVVDPGRVEVRDVEVSVSPVYDKGVSEKQLSFIQVLSAKRGLEPKDVKTKKQASKEIERLLDMPNHLF